MSIRKLFVNAAFSRISLLRIEAHSNQFVNFESTKMAFPSVYIPHCLKESP